MIPNSRILRVEPPKTAEVIVLVPSFLSTVLLLPSISGMGLNTRARGIQSMTKMH